MNPLVSHRASKNANSRTTSVMDAAEQELAAFFDAVKQLFGREQAELSADDWLRELTEIDGLPSSTHDWRLITVKASTRLATRLNASSLSAQFTNS
jgi:hypothetical protein